jgi:putative ABC transport system permease protein
MAIGGGRSRIVQQLLTESLVLGGVGGVVGMLLAAGSMPVLNRLLPPDLLVGRALTIDWRVVMFGVLLTAGISMFFGLAPAITVRRVDLRHALATNQRTGGTKAGGWWRRGLLVSQLAATMALLVIAGTLVDYVRQMYGAPLGFDPRGVVIAKMSLQGKSFDEPVQVQAFADRALEQLQHLPGVQHVALANHVPVERGLNLPLQPPPGSRIDKMRAVDWRAVTPDYFPALGIAVRRGRALTNADRGATPVSVVNESFARAYFGSEDPVGKVIALAPSMADPPREIVGVVADVRSRPGTGWTRGFTALGSEPPPTVYVPFHQMPKTVLALVQRTFPMVWILRTSGDATGSVERQMGEALRALDRQTPLIQIQPMSAVIASDISTPRAMMLAVVGFGTVALLIACIGIYGLVAYSASQRSRETAVRIALGANRLALIRAFLVETSLIAVVGVAIGLISMLALSGMLRATLGPLASIDPGTVVAITALLLAVLAAAAYVPARGAVAVDPLASLRQD